MQKKYPKITIVMTCFNREKYIAETIESVINQGYPNLEAIVIDDNSKDQSWEIIQKYKDRLAYCEKIIGTRSNPVHAINYALSKSTGDIMTTLNDKNLLMPKSLFTIAEVFTTFPEIEWITGIGLIADPEGKITNVSPLRKGFHEHLIPVVWNTQHESTFWTRSLWNRAGGMFNESWSFDNDLWARFFIAGAKLYYLNTIVGAYRKIAGAHGVSKKKEYYDAAKKARDMLRSKTSKKELIYAEIYRVLKFGKPLLRNIPDTLYQHIPILNHFCHDSIKFQNVTSDTNRLILYKRNPFRTIFPW